MFKFKPQDGSVSDKSKSVISLGTLLFKEVKIFIVVYYIDLMYLLLSYLCITASYFEAIQLFINLIILFITIFYDLH